MIMKKLFPILVLVVVSLVAVSSCGSMASEDGVKKAVEEQGYKDVEVVSKHVFWVSWQGCGKDDDVGFDLRATNASGARVYLVACGGVGPFSKGYTVRTK